jgi:hypothetical protein
MRLRASAAISTALFLCFSAPAQSDQVNVPASAGFSIAIPGTWAKRPDVESRVIARVKSSDPDGKLKTQAFAWGTSDNAEMVLVQTLATQETLTTGTFRANLKAFHDSFRSTTSGSSTTVWDVSDDGTIMTSRQEGDFQDNSTVHLVSLNEAMVDSGRHVRAFTVTCYLSKPVSKNARSACDSVLQSFKLTVDPHTLLPLEPST